QHRFPQLPQVRRRILHRIQRREVSGPGPARPSGPRPSCRIPPPKHSPHSECVIVIPDCRASRLPNPRAEALPALTVRTRSLPVALLVVCRIPELNHFPQLRCVLVAPIAASVVSPIPEPKHSPQLRCVLVPLDCRAPIVCRIPELNHFPQLRCVLVAPIAASV